MIAKNLELYFFFFPSVHVYIRPVELSKFKKNIMQETVTSGGMYKFNFELSFLIFNFVRILVDSLNYYSAADNTF